MILKKPAKIVLGILTILPLILGVGTFAFGVYQFISMAFSPNPQLPMMFLTYLSYMIPYLFLFILIYLGLGIFYLGHSIQNSALDSEKRMLWITVLITLHTFSMPVYWYVHIWKSNPTVNSEFDTPPDISHEPGTESKKL